MFGGGRWERRMRTNPISKSSQPVGLSTAEWFSNRRAIPKVCEMHRGKRCVRTTAAEYGGGTVTGGDKRWWEQDPLLRAEPNRLCCGSVRFSGAASAKASPRAHPREDVSPMVEPVPSARFCAPRRTHSHCRRCRDHPNF